jgi:acyl-CoA thioester hydrolase
MPSVGDRTPDPGRVPYDARMTIPRSGDPTPCAARAPFAIHPPAYHDRVRWSDVDAAGIVCYGRYLRFFEGAEEELFRAAGLPPDAMPRDHGVWLVRRRVSADFTHPVRLGEELETTAVVVALGRSSVRLGFAAEVAGRRVAEGEYVLVCVDRNTLEPRDLPTPVRARLSPFAERSALAAHRE